VGARTVVTAREGGGGTAAPHHGPNSVDDARMVAPGQAPMGSSGSQTWPGVDEFGGARPGLTPRGRLTTR
jgi:hypothetical protein